MNAATVAHRWANKDFGRNNTLTASNSCHSVGRNYFSYNTVFGQWLDISKNVVAIFDGSTSVTSSKYMLCDSIFPEGVNVFPLNFKGGYYGWSNCNLVSSYDFKDEDFKEHHRMQMLYHYSARLYDQFARIKNGTSKGLENVSFDAWSYFEKLCGLYKDCSVRKFIAYIKKTGWKDSERNEKAMKKMITLIANGERDVETITDAMFGDGTFKDYWDYCARFRTADENKRKMIALCHRLGLSSPYRAVWHESGCFVSNPYKTKEIRKMTAKQRNEVHFRNIMEMEERKHYKERDEKYSKNKWNAFRWITGYSPIEEKNWYTTYRLEDVKRCRNMFTGEEYNMEGDYFLGFHWAKRGMMFVYDDFRKADDKEEWIRKFYAECKLVQDNRAAISILKRIGANTKEKNHSWDDDIFVDDDFLREHTNDEEYAICCEFIKRQDKHYADVEARRRAEAIERERREAERKREEEFQKQVKQEQIDECLENGLEGLRDLWRKHLMSIYEAESYNHSRDASEFFFGGNVLLRFNLDKTFVESSMSVRVPVTVAKLWFRKVKQWHENPSTFKPIEWNTKGNGTYTVVSYEQDILTAGCHHISYAEMERMYNQIIAECE